MKAKKKKVRCTYNVSLPNGCLRTGLVFTKIMLDKLDRMDDLKKEIASNWGVGVWDVNITDSEEEDVT
jgi:hypothetical protein